MKYIVYFYSDRQVVLLEEEDVILGEYKNLSLEQWRNFGEDEVEVQAIYVDDAFRASLLMIVPNDEDDCFEILEKLRSCIERKNFKPRGLIRYCGSRVKESRRLKVLPLNVSMVDQN